jgi:hypothetical protein
VAESIFKAGPLDNGGESIFKVDPIDWRKVQKLGKRSIFL